MAGVGGDEQSGFPGRFGFRLFIATRLNSNEENKRRGPSLVA